MGIVKTFGSFVNESNSRFPHEIKSEKYWRQMAYGDKFLNDVLDTIMKKQKGFASDRQMALLKRKASGDTTPYSTKN
jgi:hypothetical protein